MRGDLNGKHKGPYDKFRYENAYRGRRCSIRFRGRDDSIDTETRNKMDVLRDNMEKTIRALGIERVHEPLGLADSHEVADESALDRESDVI